MSGQQRSKDGKYAANTLEGDTAVQAAPEQRERTSFTQMQDASEQREGEPFEQLVATSPQSIGNAGDNTSQTKSVQQILAEYERTAVRTVLHSMIPHTLFADPSWRKKQGCSPLEPSEPGQS